METVIAREMPRRHCEECGDEATQSHITALDCFAALAMTVFRLQLEAPPSLRGA
jgi:hypothetical protein